MMIDFQHNPQLLLGQNIDHKDVAAWLAGLDAKAAVAVGPTGQPYWLSNAAGLELAAAPKSRRITSVYLHGGLGKRFKQYRRPLPNGLSFEMSPADVRKTLKVAADMQSPEGDAVQYDAYTLMVEYSGDRVKRVAITTQV
jgi:hypothetical protein